jgi:hypothetical protein
VTFFAPATWLTFVRTPENVHCTTRTCVYFLVPFKTQYVEHVTGVSEHEREGEIRRERKFGRDTGNYVHVDGQGILRIHGVGDRFADVSVSPASPRHVASKSRDFVNSSREGSTTLFAISNWKFGGLMGGVLTLFTLLYVVGYSMSLIKLVLSGAYEILAAVRI